MDEHCNKTIVKRFIRNMTVHALRAVFQKTLFICRVRSGALGTFIVVDQAAHSYLYGPPNGGRYAQNVQIMKSHSNSRSVSTAALCTHECFSKLFNCCLRSSNLIEKERRKLVLRKGKVDGGRPLDNGCLSTRDRLDAIQLRTGRTLQQVDKARAAIFVKHVHCMEHACVHDRRVA